ncbi:MAG: DNA-deoxyinosine glycosylase [Woeseiaceae bacterium]|nr:DNA-deoxyinosine glycosylase [Woeseiaceae bacterium]
MSDRARGLEPVAAPDARVLILGTLPSRLSLEKRQYYGNPQNAFWRVMGELIDAGPRIAYPDRLQILRDCGIALWDVLKTANRRGSLDAAIELDGAIANDFAGFFAEHSQIQLVVFNGQTAAKLYQRLVVRPGIGTIKEIPTTTMPSTSAAHASMSFATKVQHWSLINEARCAIRRG